MATLQLEKSGPDLEEERASTPLSLTCKEDYANATDCLSEGRTTSVDAAVDGNLLVRWAYMFPGHVATCGKLLNRITPSHFRTERKCCVRSVT